MEEPGGPQVIWVRLGPMVLTALLLLATAGCSDGSEQAVPAESTIDQGAVEVEQVESVVRALQPSSPVGFDPEAWSAAKDTSRVLPAGSVVEVVAGTTVVEGEEATVDVVVSAPGAPPQRSWLFLRRVSGEWLVYGSLPLEVAE